MPFVDELEASDVDLERLLHVFKVVVERGDKVASDVIVNLPFVAFGNFVASRRSHRRDRRMVTDLEWGARGGN